MKKYLLISIMAIVLLPLINIRLLYATDLNDWLMFHRDLQNTGFVEVEITPPLSLLWKVRIGTSYAHPVASNGTVYIGSQSCLLYAIDSETGNIKWSFDLREPNHTRRSIKSAPAIYEDIIILNSWDNVVFAVNIDDGLLKWKYESKYPILYGAHSGFFINPSPTVHNGVVYIGLADGRMHAIDIETGEYVWTFDTGAVLKSTPAIYEESLFFGVGYASGKSPYLYATNMEDGDLIWEKKVQADVECSPTVKDGVVYFGASNVFYALDCKNGREKWKYTLSGGDYIESSPAVSNTTIIFSGGDWGYEPPKGSLYALDIETGNLSWSKEGYFTRISPSISGNIVYLGEHRTPNEEGRIFSLNATDGTTLWKYKTSYVVLSIPAFSGNKMFVAGGDGYLYAFIRSRIKIIEGGVTKGSTSINKLETVWFRAEYEHNSEIFDGTKGSLYLNGESMVWSSTNSRWEMEVKSNSPTTKTFEVTGVQDDKYGLTTLSDAVGPLSIHWGQKGIPGFHYESIILGLLVGIFILLLLKWRR